MSDNLKNLAAADYPCAESLEIETAPYIDGHHLRLPQKPFGPNVFRKRLIILKGKRPLVQRDYDWVDRGNCILIYSRQREFRIAKICDSLI